MQKLMTNKESWYLQYWDVNNLYGWAMLQKFPVNSFEWIEDTSQFNEYFIKNDIAEGGEGYFLEADVHDLRKLSELHNDFPFFTWDNENWKSSKAWS